ncbi:MAG: ATP-binding cassette domain-containing protein [Clostridia bacterium]|nr:ATP-binding cassette domain-containing protein [Clostridia bacterium]
MQEFIARFSANASKSRQATSRKKELEKLTLEDIKPSMRKYPYINFEFEQELGKDILTVEGLTKKGYFEDVSFTVQKGEKIAFLSDKSINISMLFDILMGIEQADAGSFKWGKTVNLSYVPQNFDSFFDGVQLSLVEWINQYAVKDHTESYLRGWLGRMLFSGEEAKKKACVLSGGEKVRCMMARAMLQGDNCVILDEDSNERKRQVIL